MDKENKLGAGGRRHITLRDATPRGLSEITGISRYAADEITYLFCDISMDKSTYDAIKTMRDIAAEKNVREGLDDPADFSLFLKRKRKKSVPLGGETVAPNKAAEEEILRTALNVIVGADEATPIAAGLIEKFGSALTVYDAAMQNISYLGVKSGVSMRLAMLLYMYLWNGKRGLSINGRAEASRFFGEIYLGGGFDGITYGYLDEDYRLIEVNNVGGQRVINQKRDEAACGLGRALGAKYMIAARKYSPDDIIAYRDLASRFSEFSQVAANSGIKLLDFIVHKRDSFFALKDGAIADGGKIEFDEFLY